jgi:hypothetical protein
MALQILEQFLQRSFPHIGFNWEMNSLWCNTSHQVHFVKWANLPSPAMLPDPGSREPHDYKNKQSADRSVWTNAETPRSGDD